MAQVAAITALVEATAGMIRLMTPWVNLEKEKKIIEERERERQRERQRGIEGQREKKREKEEEREMTPWVNLKEKL